ncbi:MAG: glycosyltransferase family 39 protein [Pyrinomonadaceae bacterium]
MAEITNTDQTGDGSLPRIAWVAFVLLAVFTYFFGLWLPFLGPDEPRYAQVAREMFERGDWITPTLGGFTWFEKPVLLYWLEIASYNLFGVNEFAARFGPTLFGLGTILSLWILGRSISKTKAQKPNTNFAKWLALIAASTLGLIVFSRGASFDIILTFPITAALVAFFVYDNSTADETKTPRHLALILFYVFIGIALLAKGLVGIVFPIAIVGLNYLLTRRLPSPTFLLSLFWGTLLAGAVAAIWYVPMYVTHGWKFVDEFLIQHHFQRFTSNKYQHPQPFYFFLWVLPLMTLPWMPFFFAAIWKSVRSTLWGSPDLAERPDGHSRLAAFSVAWIAVPLVFFSFSGSKLPGYILPAVPGAIVFTALTMFHLVRKSRRWTIAIYSAACAVFAVCLILLAVALPRFADGDSLKGLIEAANERGHADERVYGLHTISHSAEFYAAKRLLRDPEGKQKKLYSPAEVAAEMQRANVTKALVLVPPEYLKQLTDNGAVKAESIRDNGEWAIVAVSIE